MLGKKEYGRGVIVNLNMKNIETTLQQKIECIIKKIVCPSINCFRLIIFIQVWSIDENVRTLDDKPEFVIEIHYTEKDNFQVIEKPYTLIKLHIDYQKSHFIWEKKEEEDKEASICLKLQIN
jgi:hypothetical protein